MKAENIAKTIKLSARRLSAAFILFAFIFSSARIDETSSYFFDTAEMPEATFSAGYWIPTLTMEITPEEPEEDDRYTEPPCVKFSVDIKEATIYYSFSDDDASEKVEENTCIYPPEGESELLAWAVNNDNENWVSEIISKDFNVGQEIKPGDVIINEVMWMGSEGNPKDQWIELKNVSERDIHIKDWYLTYKSNAGNELKLLEIEDNRVIKSGEYYLASYYTKNNSAIKESPDSNDLENFGYEKFQIKLYTNDSKEVLIDTAGDGTQEPEEGDKDHFYSMERKNTPSDGSDYDNWYTCLDASSTRLYWDDDRNERGTPGHKNLSKNDPTSPEYDPDFQEAVSEAEKEIKSATLNVAATNETEESEIPVEIESEVATEEEPVLDEPKEEAEETVEILEEEKEAEDEAKEENEEGIEEDEKDEEDNSQEEQIDAEITNEQ